MTAEAAALIERAKRARSAVFLATDAAVAEDISAIISGLLALITEPPTDDEREAFADLLDEVHDECVTEGGCEFRGWQQGWRPGDAPKPSAHVDRILAKWRNRGRGPITDEIVDAACEAWSAEPFHRPDELPADAGRRYMRAALEAAEAARDAEAGR